MTQISLNIQNGYENKVQDFCEKNNVFFTETVVKGDYEVEGEDALIQKLMKDFAYHINILRVDGDNKPSKKDLVDKLVELNRNSIERHGGNMKYYKEANWRKSFETYSEASLWNTIAHYQYTEAAGL